MLLAHDAQPAVIAAEPMHTMSPGAHAQTVVK